MPAMQLGGLRAIAVATGLLAAGRSGLAPDRPHLDRLRVRGLLDRVTLLLPFLVHINGGHLGGEFGRVRAPVAMLPEDRDDEFRVAAGNHAHKPAIGPCVHARAHAFDGLVAGHLRAAGLAGEIDPFQVRGRGGSAHGRIGGPGHAFGDDHPGGRIKRNFGLAGAGKAVAERLPE